MKNMTVDSNFIPEFRNKYNRVDESIFIRRQLRRVWRGRLRRVRRQGPLAALWRPRLRGLQGLLQGKGLENPPKVQNEFLAISTEKRSICVPW